LFSLQLMFVRC